MIKTYCYDTRIGKLCFSQDDSGISSITTYEDGDFENIEFEETPLIKEAFKQIEEYLECKRKVFNFPLSLEGTDFQKQVWDALLRIPYGKTLSYKEIAEKIGNPKAMRAVGGACNKNPVMIVVPCHRVLGHNKSLTGYALGLHIKKDLLDLESEVSCKINVRQE